MTESNFQELKQTAKQVLKELNLPECTQTRSITILDNRRSKDILTEKNSAGIIAGAIYIAAILTENRIPQSSIADIMNISESTIQKYYAMIVKVLEIKKKND